MSQTGQADWKHRFPGTPECPENPECPGNTGCPGSPESSESPGSSWKSPKPDACGRHRVFSFAIPPASSYNNCGAYIPSMKALHRDSQQRRTIKNSLQKLAIKSSLLAITNSLLAMKSSLQKLALKNSL
jgi:hypothetical protein